MIKVNTITFHNADNYGAVLQAYALQTVLLKKYDSKILDYDCESISRSYKLFQKSNNQIVQFVKDIVNLKKNYNRKKNFNKFRTKLQLSEKYRNIQEVKDNYPKANAYITGSDQVWNPKLTNGLDDIYTLGFGKNDFKKISYAASVGSVEAIKNCEKELISKVQEIDDVSVRENTLADYLANKVNKEITTVLDPSLLLSKEDWLKIITKKRIVKEKYIFVYCGKEPDYFYDIVNELAKKTGYKILYSARRDIGNKFKYKKQSYYEKGPSDFINLIYNAEYVITASFHGTALATILNTKLIVVLNNYSDRLKTLLFKFNLEQCIANSLDDFNKVVNNNIDWNKVNKILEKEKNKSTKWLYNAIER